jgi:PAS domain S-box-containing protein
VAVRWVNLAILAIATLFLVMLVGMRVTFLERERAAALIRAEGVTRDLARVLEEYARRTFETADLTTEHVATRVAAVGGVAATAGSQAFHEELRRLMEAMTGDYLSVTDRQGRLVSNSIGLPVDTANFSDRPWFRAHVAGAERHVGEALFSRVTQEIVFTYTRALRRRDGSLDGVVQVAQRLGFFQEHVWGGEIGSGAILAMFDIDGRILARTGMTPAMVGTNIAATPLLTDFIGQASGTYHSAADPDGPARIISFRRLANWPVIVTASVPEASALAAFGETSVWSGSIVIGVSSALLLLTGFALHLTAREEGVRRHLARANVALRSAAVRLEDRVEERTHALASAHDALVESDARFRAIFDSTLQLTGLLAPDGTTLEANKTALALGGLRREDVIGRKFWETHWWDVGKPTQRRLRAAIAAAAAGIPQRYEVEVRGRDHVVTIDFSIRPLRDADGRVILLVPEGHDLTELKGAEARLREAQKMETLGQLTGGVAHDFNNLLMAILGNLALLKKRLPDDPRVTRLIDGALQGAERGAALTQRLLAFARRQELRPEPVDLAELVRGMQGLLERSVGSGVEIVAELPEGLPPAMADTNQLELALLNLVLNARDATPAGGRIQVTLSEGLAPGPAAPPGLMPGRYVRLGVRDTGTGMDAATLARAVEPFFTTKGPGRGSGLGLSMVQGLAQQSGGGLALASSASTGTVAEIWLPRALRAPDPVRPPVVQEAPAGEHRRVLVVDDDPLVVAGTAMMLEDLGHHATTAQTAAEALDLLAQGVAVDLVLTDYAMPGMNGLDLALRLRRERPLLRVALATGYAELSMAEAAWLPRINKPYRQQDLAMLVAKLTEAGTVGESLA